jgi:hypothetical protein
MTAPVPETMDGSLYLRLGTEFCIRNVVLNKKTGR